MTFALSLLVLSAISAPVDHPRTFLLSIENFPLKRGQSVEAFSFDTWGVEFKAVCRIPDGWRIKAGNSATPDGELSGEGSLGATWFNRRSPKELRNFILITLYDGVQRADQGSVPATFKGTATLSVEEGDRKVPLTYRNIRLMRARRCSG